MSSPRRSKSRHALDDARKNRKAWDADSRDYQQRHAHELGGRSALAWGIWRVPESQLKVLGPVRDRDILELGCGAAQWSVGLKRRRGRPVGLDASMEQLRHGRADMATLRRKVPLVQGVAEAVPFRDASFDIVFCDYGAMSFADPATTVPEAARLLRPGGLLAFSTTTPFLQMCWPDGADAVGTTLHTSYFGMRRMEWSADETVDFQLPYGEWIRLFRANGFTIEDLIEISPPKGARTKFPGRPLSWARRWPAEMIWKVRKT